MARKFCNKYRSESHRFPGWNYAGNGMYFLTLVTQDHDFILGNIANGEMYLSDFGEIVNTEWLKSFDMREELILDEYQIMPNHLHAIVVLHKRGNWMTDGDRNTIVDTGKKGHVDTHGRAYFLEYPKTENSFKRLPKSISSFIGGFKSGVNSKIDDYIDENNLRIPKYNKN
ncbi:MAG: REP-associated tyrosine transposase, partial [Anaerophaga sp.]|nr:REP-associated tyrosine transposase [Anaerophaga sp.]